MIHIFYVDQTPSSVDSDTLMEKPSLPCDSVGMQKQYALWLCVYGFNTSYMQVYLHRKQQGMFRNQFN